MLQHLLNGAQDTFDSLRHDVTNALEALTQVCGHTARLSLQDKHDFFVCSAPRFKTACGSHPVQMGNNP
jgi:hypothetical protein